MADDDEKYPKHNRFAWGPGEVKYLDPVTGEWKWLGEPDPERVKAAQGLYEKDQKKTADKRARSAPKVRVHVHKGR